MQQRDTTAGHLVSALRESRHLSPEQLSRAIFLAGHGYVAGKTIRAIEKDGVVPTLRVRGSLAGFFDKDAREIWRNAPIFHDRRNRVTA